MGRYRPRHAKPPRVRLVHAVPALVGGAALVAASVPGARDVAPLATPSTRIAGTTHPTGSFDATPVVLPLTGERPNSSASGAFPDSSALVLPALITTGRTFNRSTHAVPSSAKAAYRLASVTVATQGCQVPVPLLAAIGAVVSDHGRVPASPLLDGSDGYLMADTDKGRYDGSSAVDGPVGPMGLLPWTFVHVRASELASPTALPDAALAAARFLCAGSKDLRSHEAQRAALASYDANPDFAIAVLATEKVLSRRGR